MGHKPHYYLQRFTKMLLNEANVLRLSMNDSLMWNTHITRSMGKVPPKLHVLIRLRPVGVGVVHLVRTYR